MLTYCNLLAIQEALHFIKKGNRKILHDQFLNFKSFFNLENFILYLHNQLKSAHRTTK
jgi:hypothetical protein